MGGLRVMCAVLGVICLALLVRGWILNRRIRRMSVQIDAFLSGRAEMLDVALREGVLDELQNGIADLQQALVRTKQLNAEECDRTGQLIADISHQLKTPLTTLRLYTELDEAAHMQEALEQIQRMETLVQSLLRLERLCSDGYAFTFAEADAEAIIREQWQHLQPIFPRKRLQIEGTARIRCDEKWLGEAFLNLLKNACEHTPGDGAIFVRLERTEAVFFCTVEDNGGGVPERELPKLFRRFYRAQDQKTGGAGIGLAIVKEIIVRHHGSIVAENGEKGLRMIVSMPMLDRNLANS